MNDVATYRFDPYGPKHSFSIKLIKKLKSFDWFSPKRKQKIRKYWTLLDRRPQKILNFSTTMFGVEDISIL